MKILVIDDENDIRRIARLGLERLRSLGATGVLTKPVDAMTLGADVRALLDRS